MTGDGRDAIRKSLTAGLCAALFGCATADHANHEFAQNPPARPSSAQALPRDSRPPRQPETIQHVGAVEPGLESSPPSDAEPHPTRRSPLRFPHREAREQLTRSEGPAAESRAQAAHAEVTSHRDPSSPARTAASALHFASEETERVTAPPPPSRDTPAAPHPLPAPPDEHAVWERPIVPLDLATALAIASGQNPRIGIAQARINESYARYEAAEALWLPSIRIGVNYNKHEGRLQDVEGEVIDVSRSAAFGGFGAGAIAAGSPTVPGVVMEFHAADAVYQPEIAGRINCARRAAAVAVTNDQLLETALAYLQLLNALQQREIALETLANAEDLADLTEEFAEAGQGTRADADRAAAALAVQKNVLLQAEEAVSVATARLAQQLSIDMTATLIPQEVSVVPLEIAPAGVPLPELVATGLSNRPELAESRHLVAEAVQRLRREQYAPLLPSVLLGASFGGFGGGTGDNLQNFSDRFDFDAVAYWEVRNVGFGEQAARREARARVDEARFRELQVMDNVAREIVEAEAQVEARRQQIEIARQGIESSTRSYERNLERIRNAQGLPIEVLQSFLALDDARRNYLRAIVNFNEAQFRLQRALGWPIR